MKPFQSAFQWGRLLLGLVLVWAPALTPISFAQAETLAPQLTAVQPDRAANDVDTPIEIRGEHFSNEESLPQVFLGSTPLPQIVWEDENTLSALVPWGIHAGVYDLRVINPDGSEDTLETAFTVTEGVGQWNANAMDGGPVQAVIPVPSVSGLLYAYSNVTSAIYRSTDSAAHWETVGHANGQFFKNDPHDPQRLYLNNLQSTDGGATWSDLLANEPWPGAEQGPGWYTQTFPDPNHAGTLFLATANIPASSSDPSGLLRSQDNGQTWEAVETGLLSGDTHVTALAFSGSAIYLGTRDGNLYQSSNSGTSWQQIGSSNVLESIGILEINPYHSNELWITTHFSISANARVAKMDLSSPLHPVTQLTWPETDYPMNLGFLDANTAYIGTRWDSGWILYNGGQDLMSFQPSTGKPGNWLALDPWDDTKETFYIADEQYGVQKTSNASALHWDRAAWTPVNQGLHAMSPDSLGVDPQNPARVYAKIAENGWPGIFVSNDGGQNWTFSSLEAASSGVRPVTSMLAVNGERIFAGAHGNSTLGYGPQVYRSDNQGSSWDRISLTPATGFTDSFHMPWVLKADPHQPANLLLLTVIGNRDMTTEQFVSEIYRSTDNGEHWQPLELAEQLGHAVNNLTSLAFDPHIQGVVYAAGDHEILKSTDSGLTWTVLRKDDHANLIGPIAVEPVAPYRVYVGNAVSSDGGQTWEDAQLPIFPEQIVFVPGSDTVYVGGDGLFFSTNGGNTWQRAEGAPGTTRINALAVSRSGERTMIFIGTPGSDAPESARRSARSDAENLLPLEAGIYRLTEVHYSVFLPVIRR
jgi:photosystem II stability/assembly factor-like uncharacterized protein